MTLSGIASELLSPASGDHNMPSEGWQQWKQRDEQVRREQQQQQQQMCELLSQTVDNVLLIIDVPFRKLFTSSFFSRAVQRSVEGWFEGGVQQ